MTPDLYKLAAAYRASRDAYRAEMEKRTPEDPLGRMVTREEVAARDAMNQAQLALLVAAEDLKPREDGPVALPDLRLDRAEKLLVEEALARTGSIRLAAQLLGISMARMRSALKRHAIAWPSPR
jgi:transcriptional regulator with GAF, ATPase, and Fis domain